METITTPATITLETKVELKEYIDLNFNLMYKKPIMLFITLLGVFCIIDPFIEPFWKTGPIDDLTWAAFTSGIIIVVVFPFLIYRALKRSYNNSTVVRLLTRYTFSATGVSMENELSTTTFTWAAVNKVKEVKDWIFVYRGAQAAWLSKKTFEAGQLEQFKTMLRSIPDLKLELKKDA